MEAPNDAQLWLLRSEKRRSGPLLISNNKRFVRSQTAPTPPPYWVCGATQTCVVNVRRDKRQDRLLLPLRARKPPPIWCRETGPKRGGVAGANLQVPMGEGATGAREQKLPGCEFWGEITLKRSSGRSRGDKMRKVFLTDLNICVYRPSSAPPPELCAVPSVPPR